MVDNSVFLDLIVNTSVKGLKELDKLDESIKRISFTLRILNVSNGNVSTNDGMIFVTSAILFNHSLGYGSIQINSQM